MSFVYPHAKHLAGTAGLDFQEAGGDFRIILLGSGSTAGTEEDETTLAGFTTLAELVATNYTTGGKTLDSQTFLKNATFDWSVFDADDLTWSSLGDAGSPTTIVGAMVILWQGSLNASNPVFYYDSDEPGLPASADGSDFVWSWNASGIARVV